MDRHPGRTTATSRHDSRASIPGPALRLLKGNSERRSHRSTLLVSPIHDQQKSLRASDE